MAGRKHLEAKQLSQSIKLFTTRLGPGRIGGENVGADTELVGNEG